jgi:DNA-binding CsgD family transcriptional regulator
MKRNEILKRREEFKDEIFALMVQGHNAADIARKLGSKRQYVLKLLNRSIEEYGKGLSNVAKVHAAIDLARLEKAIKAISDKVDAGDKYAIETMIKLLDRKAKLLGLDKPTKVDVSVQMSLSALVAGSLDTASDAAIEVNSTIVNDAPDALPDQS